MRIYEGKALDVISCSVDGKDVSASVEFLNDGEQAAKGQLFMGIYKNGKAEKFVTIPGDGEVIAERFGSIGYEFEKVEFQSKEEDIVELRFFLWNSFGGFAPMTREVSVSR